MNDIKPWFNNFETICRHDCHWYAFLANDYKPIGFFPLYSFVMKALKSAFFLDITYRALSVACSVFFTVVAGFVILKLGNALWPISNKEGEKGILNYSPKAWLLLLALSIFPHSHYWIYGYSESFFMVLFAGSSYFIVKKRWLLASLLVGLVAISRPQGIWILAVYSLCLIYQNINTKKLFDINALKRIFWNLFLANSFFALFVGWHYFETGNPLAFIKAHEVRGRFIDILEGFRCHLPVWEADYFFLVLSLVAVYRFLQRKEFFWLYLGGITLLMAEVPLFIGGYYAFSRFMSVNLGMFILLVELTANRRILQVGLIAWCIVYLGMGVHQWFIGLPIF